MVSWVWPGLFFFFFLSSYCRVESSLLSPCFLFRRLFLSKTEERQAEARGKNIVDSTPLFSSFIYISPPSLFSFSSSDNDENMRTDQHCPLFLFLTASSTYIDSINEPPLPQRWSRYKHRCLHVPVRLVQSFLSSFGNGKRQHVVYVPSWGVARKTLT